MCRRIIADVKQGTQGAHGVKKVHVSRGIIRKDIGGIKLSRTHLKNSVCPGGKTGGIIVKAPGESGSQKPQKQSGGKKEKYAVSSMLSSFFDGEKTEDEQEQSEPGGKMYVKQKTPRK